MSDPRLPPEISDYIVDLLHDQPQALKRCCLISKSWVLRSRKHIFREIVFRHTSDLEAWKDTFPNPANSPAHYTHHLSFSCSVKVIMAIVDEGDYWIPVFSSVVKLNLLGAGVVFPPSKPYIRTLICSLPNLEDLTVTKPRVTLNEDIVFEPSTSPPLTGTLEVTRTSGTEGLATLLLGLPNGIHFRKFKFSWNRETDTRWVMALVEACSDTLKHIDLEPPIIRDARATSIDFSKATKLRSVVLRVQETSVLQVAIALKTITAGHRDLQEVAIHINFLLSAFFDNPVDARRIFGDETYAPLMDFDRLLVRLSESGAIHVRIRCWSSGENKKIREYIEDLLPEMAKGGGTKLVEYSDL